MNMPGTPQVIASTDDPAYFERDRHCISSISAVPSDGDGQISVSIQGGAAVEYPVGRGYEFSSGGGLIPVSIRINVLAGSVVFSSGS